jgi:hypothetical protein
MTPAAMAETATALQATLKSVLLFYMLFNNYKFIKKFSAK